MGPAVNKSQAHRVTLPAGPFDPAQITFKVKVVRSQGQLLALVITHMMLDTLTRWYYYVNFWNYSETCLWNSKLQTDKIHSAFNKAWLQLFFNFKNAYNDISHPLLQSMQLLLYPFTRNSFLKVCCI